MKKVMGTYTAPPAHWVGNGFPVRSMFSYQSHRTLSPFLLLDYAGPQQFAPTTEQLGVGEHPHRGFETVTIVYEGELAHRDSMGNGGVIGPGDVQWMTAGSGILHEEYHSPAFSQSGGVLEMVQLWVNLPAHYKLTRPDYQAIVDRDIPRISIPDNAGHVRIIAGEYDGQKGVARTFSPVNVWDMRLQAGARTRCAVPAQWSVALVVLRGSIEVNDATVVGSAQMAVLSEEGEKFDIKAIEDAAILLLSGEPLHEPVVWYGPFVMNTQNEILEAIEDLKSGAFAKRDK